MASVQIDGSENVESANVVPHSTNNGTGFQSRARSAVHIAPGNGFYDAVYEFERKLLVTWPVSRVLMGVWVEANSLSWEYTGHIQKIQGVLESELQLFVGFS